MNYLGGRRGGDRGFAHLAALLVVVLPYREQKMLLPRYGQVREVREADAAWRGIWMREHSTAVQCQLRNHSC